MIDKTESNYRERDMFLPLETIEWLKNDLPRQFKERIETLNKFGLLDILSDDYMGIVGIDGREYSFPTQEKIADAIKGSSVFSKKMKQGFTELEICPIALPTERFFESFRRALLKYDEDEGLALLPGYSEQSKAALIKLDRKIPLKILGEVEYANIGKNLSYYPQDGNMKKEDIIGSHAFLEKSFNIYDFEATFPGYNVFLREKIHKPSSVSQEEQYKRGRYNIKRKIDPIDYFRMVNPQDENDTAGECNYCEESGMTVEDFVTIFLTHLNRTGQIISHTENADPFVLAGNSINGRCPIIFWHEGSDDREPGYFSLREYNNDTMRKGQIYSIVRV